MYDHKKVLVFINLPNYLAGRQECTVGSKQVVSADEGLASDFMCFAIASSCQEQPAGHHTNQRSTRIIAGTFTYLRALLANWLKIRHKCVA